MLILKKLPIISIFLSAISVLATIVINIQIAKAYQMADGKTRALFGITEIYRFGYQRYSAILGLLSLILAILGSGNPRTRILSILFAIAAIALVFCRIWRIFVFN